MPDLTRYEYTEKRRHLMAQIRGIEAKIAEHNDEHYTPFAESFMPILLNLLTKAKDDFIALNQQWTEQEERIPRESHKNHRR